MATTTRCPDAPRDKHRSPHPRRASDVAAFGPRRALAMADYDTHSLDYDSQRFFAQKSRILDCPDRRRVGVSGLSRRPSLVYYNPVRPGLLERPEDWRWSSARVLLAGLDDPIAIDRTIPTWRQFVV